MLISPASGTVDIHYMGLSAIQSHCMSDAVCLDYLHVWRNCNLATDVTAIIFVYLLESLGESHTRCNRASFHLCKERNCSILSVCTCLNTCICDFTFL